MSERVYQSEREREAIERALANEELMRQEREAQASVERGESPIPGWQVHKEARDKRA